MYNNLRKTFKKVSTACFVLLLSTTTLADKFQEIQLCDKNSGEKCVKLTYEQGQLVVKNSDNKDATLNIAKASFSDDVVFGKKIIVTDRAGFACTDGNYDNCKSWINPTNATFRSIDVIGDASLSKLNVMNVAEFKSEANFREKTSFGQSRQTYFDVSGSLWKWINHTDKEKQGWYRLSVNNVESDTGIKSWWYAHWWIYK